MAVRVFIGFFGLARALDRTIDSIETNIFAPLTSENIEIVRAAHLNCPQFVHAPRSGEHMIRYNAPDLSRLRLDASLVEEQSDEKVAPYLRTIMDIPQFGEKDDDGNMRRNVVHQMNSLKGLGRLFSSLEPHSYSAVIILRPDLRYIDPLPIRKFLAQLDPSARLEDGIAHRWGQSFRRFGRRVDLITPDWHQWNGFNDRIAIATPRAANVYLNRIDRLKDYAAANTHFQSEHMLKFTADQAGLRTTVTWIRANRVRATGEEEERDIMRRGSLIGKFVLPLRASLQI